MRMADADIRRFPRFAYYVRVNIPEVITVPSIVAAMGSIGQLSRSDFQAALRWRHGPSILLTPGLICTGVASYGCFRNASPNQVELKEEWVQQFEDGHGTTTTPNGNRIFLIGVKLLHELVHWADFRDGVSDGAPGEAGNAFEQRVYGGVVHAA